MKVTLFIALCSIILSLNSFSQNIVVLRKSLFHTGTSFKLTKNDFKRVDSILNICTIKYGLSLPRFKRQYYPYKAKDGSKHVYVNCACYVDDINRWRKEEIIVTDGADCYFNVIINLKDNTYSEFGGTGVAIL
jgi:hypothetical protein